MPPYWPWVQAIRSYVREHEPDQLRSEMGAGAADIAEVVSDVKERLPDLSPPPQLDSPEQARFRLFDSITAFLKSASQKQPLVLVLDDLHWADQPSLLLLQFLARELGNSRLLLVGTYRDMELSRQHPLAESLGELTRERLFQRVLLRGLSQQDVGRFIEVAAGVDPPPSLAEAVHTQTEGNPLFVTEVVRLLVQEGELTQESGARDSWTVRIPEGVREVIGRRLNRLSQRCNETLTIASIVGREFELRQLSPLVEDMSEDRLLEVLEEALAARVIEELPQSVGRYQFTHALIQETLSEELTLTRRVRLHARIAEALEALYGANAEAHAAELAYHYTEAEPVLGTGKLVRYSLVAGERDLGAYAWGEALEHFQRGIEAIEGVAMNAQAAALWFGLGRAQLATLPRQRWQEATDSLRRAFDYYAETGDVDRAVAVAEHPFSTLFGSQTGMVQITSRALALVPPGSPQGGRLFSRHGILLVTETGDFEGAQEAFDKALAIAHGVGDATLEMLTLTNYARAELYRLRYPECLEKCLSAVELADRADDPCTETLAHDFAARILIWLGEPAMAQQHVAATMKLAATCCRAQLATLPRQRWQEATDSLRRAFDYYAETGDVDRAVAVAEHPFSTLFGSQTGMVQITSRALALVPPGSPQGGRLFSRHGILLVTETGDFEGAQEAFDKALAIAHGVGDATLEMLTLTNYARAELYRLRYPECLEKCLSAVELADRADDPCTETLAHDFAARILIWLGEPAMAQQHVAATMKLAESQRDAYSLGSGYFYNTCLAYLGGDLQAARGFSDQGFAFSPNDTRLLMVRTVLEYQRGDFLQGEAYLERLLEVMHQTPPGPTLEYAATAVVIPMVARISGMVDRLDAAEVAAGVVVTSPSATPVATRYANRARAFLAVLRGDQAASREQYALLEPQRGFMYQENTCSDGLLGLLAHTMGNLDQAMAHFEDALTFCSRAGYRPELAWTCCDYADTLLQRNEPGDREKAMSLLDESLAISSELGMRPLMERVFS